MDTFYDKCDNCEMCNQCCRTPLFVLKKAVFDKSDCLSQICCVTPATISGCIRKLL